MFSVPGWSVTPSVATQTQTRKNESKSNDKVSSNGSMPSGPGKSLKRKRGRESGKVDDGNVEQFWDRVIEGKTIDESIKKSKSRDSFKSSGVGDSVQHKKPKKERVQKNHAKVNSHEHGNDKSASGLAATVRQTSTSQPSSVPEVAPGGKLTPLQASMRAKLSSARFRHLNEQLYTKPSSTSLSLFVDTPSLFEEYHTGFRQQVAVWPENPVDGYMTEIRQRAKLHKHFDRKRQKSQNGPPPLPRSSGTTTIADLGCGDAMLAQTLQPELHKLRLKIHSFDLHSPHPLVTRADISSLPLPDGSVDVAIFCLALMGTNWLDFIDEAYRVMRFGSELWVAEIKSRFSRADSSGPGSKKKVGNKIGDVKKQSTKDEKEQEEDAILAMTVDGAPATEKTNVQLFVAALKRHGFVLVSEDKDGVDMSNKMFVKMRFIKSARPVRGKNVGTVSDEIGVKDHRDRFKKQSKKGKFLEDVDDETVEDEGTILKPCVYKLR